MRHLLAASILVITASQGLAMDSLSEFNWKNRVVLVFGDVADQKVEKQLDLLQRQKQKLDDRDMVVIHVAGQKAQTVYGASSSLNSESLRKDAGVMERGFHVILVGKDGGVKLRSEQVVTDIEIFDLIDRMPMRQTEQN